MKSIFFILITLCIIGRYECYSQDLDTIKIIQDIREKFALIHNKEIKGIKECDYEPSNDTDEDQDEMISGGAHEFTFYFAESNIYLIREYIMSDEGGPLTYSASISEIYLFDNKPFFYYRKDFYGDYYDDETGKPIYGLQETRKYIYKGKIIRQLTKFTRKDGIWLYDKSLLLDVKTDTVPNIKQHIKEHQDDFYFNPKILKNIWKL